MAVELSKYDILDLFKLWKKAHRLSINKCASELKVDRSFLRKIIIGVEKPPKKFVEKMSYLILSRPVDFNSMSPK